MPVKFSDLFIVKVRMEIMTHQLSLLWGICLLKEYACSRNKTPWLALTYNDKLVSFNLGTKVQHTQIFSSHFELSSAVALTTDHFCTTRSYNLLKFPHHGQTRGNMLELDGMDAVRLCSWKGDKLLLLFEDSNDQHACLALLDSTGQLVL